jgi:TPR repeat protein
MQEAARWYRRAGDSGYPAALNSLGNMYLEGKLGQADPNKARELFERSAKQNDADGIAWLGLLYERGAGVTKNLETARAQFVKAANTGNTWSMRHLAQLLIAGQLRPHEDDEARKWLMKAAQRGDSSAMTDLGDNYRRARFGGPPDFAAAREWFEKAAERGNAAAMFQLGFAYDAAQGVPRDYGIARGWYEKAAERGYAAAKRNIGFMYEYAHGVPQNFSKAWQYYEAAAEQGDSQAMIYMGQMTQAGKGMAPNLNGALKWYQKAADAGSSDGAWRVVALIDRYSKNKDVDALAKIALDAAKRGSSEAIQGLFRGPQQLSRELRAAIETRLANEGFYEGPVRGRFDRKSREALEAYLRNNQ